MFNTNHLKNILFIDIETVGAHEAYDLMDPVLKKQWRRKVGFLKNEEALDEAELFYQRAGIYAEFGKVVVIGVGFFHEDDGELRLRVKSLKGDDERILLEDFGELLQQFDEDTYLCAHNGKEFDFPYLCRRLIIHGLPLPGVLDLSGKKPWEVKHYDTMNMWKFGDFKNYTSLELLAAVLQIQSSKDEIDGSMVNEIYYKEENGLEQIAEYCMKDVAVTARIFLKLNGLQDIPEDNITFVK